MGMLCVKILPVYDDVRVFCAPGFLRVFFTHMFLRVRILFKLRALCRFTRMKIRL